MASLFQSGNYSVINTADTKINRLYIIKFISEAYTLQNDSKIDGQVISAVGLFFKAQYIFSMT